MNSRDLVRTAVVIGGVYLIVSSFSSVASLFAGFAESSSRLDRDFAEAVSDLFAFYLPSSIGAVFFGAVPGIYAIWSAEAWAARLTPADESTTTLEPSLALSVGAMILGLSFGVSGAVSLATGGLLVAVQIASGAIGELSAVFSLRTLLYGACSLVAGVLLFRWGGSGVIRAA